MKISTLFILFYDNIDSTLLKTLKGEKWLNLPFNWENYK